MRATRDELVALTSALVALDTTARDAGAPPRAEAELQRLLAARLAALGAEIDLWEPEPTGEGGQFVPPGLDFVGRPQLVARLAGDPGGRPAPPGGPRRRPRVAGSSRSLLLTGHIDAVDVEPREQWTSDPFVATERDGLLFGRGANDMKGGLAALVVALEALRDAGVTLAGEVVFAAVTDEESSGMGSWSVVRRFAERGIHPDAGLCAEPTEFEAWVACRGILKPRLTIPGRAGHSQEPQPDWRDGGAVNAIDKLVPVLTEVRRINDDWRTRADQRHPFLAPGDIVPVLVDGGTWDVTYPAFCHLTLDCHYLPASLASDARRRARQGRDPRAHRRRRRGRPLARRAPDRLGVGVGGAARRDRRRPPARDDRARRRRRPRTPVASRRPRLVARRRDLHAARRRADLLLRPARHEHRPRRQRVRLDRRARRHGGHRRRRRHALVRCGRGPEAQ